MRRFFLLSSLLGLLLGACVPQQNQSTLPPEEVLRRAAQESAVLESAQFDVSGSFSWKDPSQSKMSGSFTLAGVLQGGGQQVEFTATVDAVSTSLLDSSNLRAVLDIVNAGQEELYLRIVDLSSQSDVEYPLFPPELVKQFGSQWWKLSGSAQTGVPVTMTPDSKLISAQASVVHVVRDQGVSPWGNRAVHMYDVEIDPEKLHEYLRELATQKGEPYEDRYEPLSALQATGKLYIDTESYRIHRIEWTVSPLKIKGEQSISGTFTLNLSKHNTARPINVPTDAIDFTPLMFFDAQLQDSGDTPTVPEGFDKAVLNDLLQLQGKNSYTTP